MSANSLKTSETIHFLHIFVVNLITEDRPTTLHIKRRGLNNLWKGLHALTFDLGKPKLHHSAEPTVQNGLRAKIELWERCDLQNCFRGERRVVSRVKTWEHGTERERQEGSESNRLGSVLVKQAVKTFTLWLHMN